MLIIYNWPESLTNQIQLIWTLHVYPLQSFGVVRGMEQYLRLNNNGDFIAMKK